MRHHPRPEFPRAPPAGPSPLHDGRATGKDESPETREEREAGVRRSPPRRALPGPPKFQQSAARPLGVSRRPASRELRAASHAPSRPLSRPERSPGRPPRPGPPLLATAPRPAPARRAESSAEPPGVATTVPTTANTTTTPPLLLSARPGPAFRPGAVLQAERTAPTTEARAARATCSRRLPSNFSQLRRRGAHRRTPTPQPAAEAPKPPLGPPPTRAARPLPPSLPPRDQLVGQRRRPRRGRGEEWRGGQGSGVE